MIKLVNWKTIYGIWSTQLWPNRTSKIEPVSAMCYLEGFDMSNMSYKPKFFGYYIDNKIVGVNSGHRCNDNSYRSRGLWVDKNYRKQGIGTALLKETIAAAGMINCHMVWSYPRRSSWSTYNRAGFTLSSDWHASETSDSNAYCYIKLCV